MIPWVRVDEARAADGTVLSLMRRGDEWEVCHGRFVFLSSRAHGSEEELARLAFARVRRVLVAGLGLGFTLRATLDLLDPAGRVVVAKQSPAVVEWTRTHVGFLAGRPTEDPRVTVRVGDAGGPDEPKAPVGQADRSGLARGPQPLRRGTRSGRACAALRVAATR